jgi:hypothetical protein
VVGRHRSSPADNQRPISPQVDTHIRAPAFSRRSA